VIIRYFQIVDLITNFFSKLNIETPPIIDDIIRGLKKLDFPKIGFLESMSITNDGGKDQADKYIENKEEKEKIIDNQITSENESKDRLLAEIDPNFTKKMMQRILSITQPITQFFEDKKPSDGPNENFFTFVKL
jgi:hypothetical protein